MTDTEILEKAIRPEVRNTDMAIDSTIDAYKTMKKATAPKPPRKTRSDKEPVFVPEGLITGGPAYNYGNKSYGTGE